MKSRSLIRLFESKNSTTNEGISMFWCKEIIESPYFYKALKELFLLKGFDIPNAYNVHTKLYKHFWVTD